MQLKLSCFDDLPEGEWKKECDAKIGICPITNYHLFVIRQRGGHLCGYVGVPENHPFFGKEYSDIEIEVHGGLTYSSNKLYMNFYKGTSGLGSVIITLGYDENLWYFGFDCIHGGDFAPVWDSMDGYPCFDCSYRNIKYVTHEVNNLARQLKRFDTRGRVAELRVL